MKTTLLTTIILATLVGCNKEETPQPTPMNNTSTSTSTSTPMSNEAIQWEIDQRVKYHVETQGMNQRERDIYDYNRTTPINPYN